MLTSSRLDLRYMHFDDVSDIFAYLSKSNVHKYLNRMNHQRIEDTYFWLNQNVNDYEKNMEPYLLVMVEKETKHVIGHIEIYNIVNESIEIGFMLHDDYWHKGFMSEAFNVLFEAMFIRNKHLRIFAKCNVANLASIKLLKENGFKQDSEVISKDMIGYYSNQFNWRMRK